VSLIAEVHALNRDTLECYVEVLLKVPLDILRRRDPELYAAAERGDALLPGVNQPFDYPTCPHMVLEQAEGDLSLEHAVGELLKWMD
jgi:adenylylsulfate kinase